MRRFLALMVLAVSAAIVLAACNSNENKNAAPRATAKTPPTSTITPPSDGVRRITTVELRDAVSKGTAVIVDVRPEASYQQNHIKGALHIPLEGFPSRIGELPRDKMIVTYCS